MLVEKALWGNRDIGVYFWLLVTGVLPQCSFELAKYSEQICQFLRYSSVGINESADFAEVGDDFCKEIANNAY